MDFNFVSMNKEYANEIAYEWKYKDEYSFYDMTSDEEDLREFLDEESWKDTYFAVTNNEKKLVGFFSYVFEDEVMSIGLGLKPEVTGIGMGKEFVSSGIEFGVGRFNYKKDSVILAVATFNKRAISVYEEVGFEIVDRYTQSTNGSNYEFTRMRKMI